MGGLVELLDVGLQTNAQSDTGAESLAVAQGSDTLVVELTLDEGAGVESVLDSSLEANVALGGGSEVPGGASTNLGSNVNTVVDGGGVEREVVGGSQGNTVSRGSVADLGSKAGESGLLDVVAELGTTDEALLAQNKVTGEGRLEDIGNDVGVDARVLEVEVQLGSLGARGGKEGGVNATVKTLGEGVRDLDLGVEHVAGEPALGEGDTGGAVGVLGLELAGEGVVLLVGLALNSEGDAVGSNGADLNAEGSKVVEILAQDVVRLLRNVFEGRNRHSSLVLKCVVSG